MKNERSVKEVGSIWGLITLVLSKLVAPLPTANRWLLKMGEPTDNLLSYGLAKVNIIRLERSLQEYQLTSY